MKKNRIVTAALFGILLLCAVAATACKKPTTVALDCDNAVLRVGESITLAAVSSDGSPVEYTSSNVSCATVAADGTVTAIAEGATVITAFCGDSVAVCEIVVYGVKPVPLETLSIDGLSSGQLENRATATLSCAVAPIEANDFYALVWSSSDRAVLTVDEHGGLTATGVGAATVTVRAVGTDVSAQKTVQVTPRPSTLQLDYDDVLGTPATTLKLTRTIGGDHTPVSVTWKSSDETVAAVEDGEIAFKAVGRATVTCSAVFADGTLSRTCRVTVRDLQGYTIIRTPEQLAAIGNVSGNYALGNDIDMTEACAEGGACYNGGAGFQPLFNRVDQLFSGVFDGCGYKIENLVINRPSQALSALFLYIGASNAQYGLIRNLQLVGGKISGNYAAAFFANCIGGGTTAGGLENCYADMEIVGRTTAAGLSVGCDVRIENCLFAGTLTCDNTTYALAARHSSPASGRIVSSFALEGCADRLHGLPDECADATSKFVTAEQAAKKDTFVGWDETVWQFGQLPRLRSPFEAGEVSA